LRLPPDPDRDELSFGAAALPAESARTICDEIRSAVGPATIVLGGSRAVGNAADTADCDISVLLPLWRIPLTVRRLGVAAARVSSLTGLKVSVNPMPRQRFIRPGKSLYALKLRSEGVVLSNGPGVPPSLGPVVGTRAAPRAVTSYLMSAVHVLLLGVEPTALATGEMTAAGRSAVRKACLQVAQARLLARGSYVSQYEDALDRLGDKVLRDCGAHPGEVQSFLTLRRRLLGMLGPEPMARVWHRALAQDLQFVLISALRHRNRIVVAGRTRGIEGALARASILLLVSLDPKESSGFDQRTFDKAVQALPEQLRPSPCAWHSVRSVVVGEWANAHPLVGMML
jgi:hypothetical protein